MLSSVILVTTDAFASNEKDLVTIQLKWKHNFQFAGYYAALEQGYFDDEGLNVRIVEGGPGINPVTEVLEKKSQYGVEGSDLIYYRLQKKPLVVLASIFQHSASALAALKSSGIMTPHDLSGKNVAMLVGNKPITEIVAMLEFEGVPLDSVILSENETAEDIFKEHDAEHIYLTNEPYIFKQLKEDVNLIKPINYGIDFYGDSLFTTESEVRNHPGRAETVKRAVIKGWEYALQHPDKMAHYIKNTYSTRDSIDHMKYQASAIKKLILPNIIEVGHINSYRWRRMADTIIRLNMVSNSDNFDGFIYKPSSSTDKLWGALGIIFTGLVFASLLSIIFWFINRQLKKHVKIKTEELLESNTQLNEEVFHRKQVEKELQKHGVELERIVDLRTRELHIEVAEHHNTIKSLSASESKLQGILSSMTDTVYLIDANKYVTFYHAPEIGRLSSLTDESIIGKTLDSLIPTSDITKFEEAIEKNKHGQIAEFDYSSHTAEEKQWYSVKISPIFEGEVYKASLTVSRNISYRKNNEKELEKARQYAERANEIKGKFLANISHEIRTPLNTITGMSYLLQQTVLENKQKNYLGHIHTASHTLIHIIDDILDFSKAEAGTLKFESSDLNIHALIDNVCKALDVDVQRKKLVLIASVDERIPTQLNGFTLRLTQVLNNLLSNAIKFSKEGGRIDLQVVITEQNNKQLILSFKVKDTGIGISGDDITKLFKPFSQVNSSLSREYSGTGLGLAISQNLVNAMGGQIECQSTLNLGSIFSFTIPLNYQQSVLLEQEKYEESETNIPKTHILVVDDDELNRMIVSELLKPYVDKIVGVESAQKALNKIAEDAFSIVFMDVQMPGMDGYEATYRIRQNPKFANLPIIAMTAHASKEDHDRSLDAGMNDHLTKPVSPEKLLYVLKKWTDICPKLL